MTKRLARLLLDVDAEQPGARIAPTHQELASCLGTVREVVSRNLAPFRVQGYIRIEGRDIAVVNIAGLKTDAEAES